MSPTRYEPRCLPRVTGLPTEPLRWRPRGQVVYPFLIQLVGFWIGKLADAGAEETDSDVVLIDETIAAAGVQAARRRLGSLIHEPALRDLSHVDRTFLAAMAVDDGPSRMADVASRLDADANYASQYRLRLIAADMIQPAGHGQGQLHAPVPTRLPARARRHDRPLTKPTLIRRGGIASLAGSQRSGSPTLDG